MTTANRSEIRYVEESAWGVMPATPAFKAFRHTGEGLNANITKAVSEEIRGDRNEPTMINVGADALGDINYELSYTSYDDILQALLCSTWVVDGVDTDKFTLVNGVLERSFSFQKNYLDITQLFNFPGTKINTGSLEIMPGKIVSGSFGVMSKGGHRTAVQETGATFPAVPTTTPMNGASGVTLAQIDAGSIVGGLMRFTMQINNNRRAQKVVGSNDAQAIVAGKFQVTGDIEIYFVDGTYYDKFEDSVPFAVQVKMAGPGTTNEIWIDLPNAEFERGEVVSQATDTDVLFKASYRGLYNAGIGGSVKFTRQGPL